ncbi:MAG: gas vesicle protein GvpJ [Gemmatimonadaceae bacterium]
MTADPSSKQPAAAPSEVETVGGGLLFGEDPMDLSDLLNTVLDRGAVVHGEVTIAVADVDLIKLNLGLLLQAVATAELRSRAREGNASPASLSGAMGAIPRRRETVTGPVGSTVRPGKVSPPAGGYDSRSQEPEPATVGAAAPKGGPEAYSEGAQEPVERSLNAVAQGLPERINADAAGPETGLARLVLTLIEVLRKVLEHQAVRRMEGGRLSGEEIERLGLALAKLNDRMGELKRVFGLSDDDLNIDLGPLGRLK